MPECSALFDTAFGTCGIVWRPAGIVRLHLPEADTAATEARLRRYAPGAERRTPPRTVGTAIKRLQQYFEGIETDFDGIALDLAHETGGQRGAIYAAARRVGWGETTTYGALARAIGQPGGARGVGQAMASNPVPIIIPCHRVLASGGRLGGFSAHGGTATKERLLVLERALLPL